MAVNIKSLKGKYVIPHTGVESIFGGRDNPYRRSIRRSWPFLVTEAGAAGFKGINVATHHLLNIGEEDVSGCSGAGSYADPIILKMKKQICWDDCRLWFEPLARFRPHINILRMWHTVLIGH